MTDKDDSFKFIVSPVKAENSSTWSYNMEVILRGRGLWKYVLTPKPEQDDEDGEQVAQMEQEAMRVDLSLAYILTSVDNSCKPLFRQVWGPNRARSVLCDTLHTVSEAAIDVKLTNLQALTLKRGEYIVE